MKGGPKFQGWVETECENSNDRDLSVYGTG